MRSTGSPFMDKNKLQTFLKDPLLKKPENYSNQSRTMMGLLTGHSFEMISKQTGAGKQS